MKGVIQIMREYSSNMMRNETLASHLIEISPKQNESFKLQIHIKSYENKFVTIQNSVRALYNAIKDDLLKFGY